MFKRLKKSLSSTRHSCPRGFQLQRSASLSKRLSMVPGRGSLTAPYAISRPRCTVAAKSLSDDMSANSCRKRAAILPELPRAASSRLRQSSPVSACSLSQRSKAYDKIAARVAVGNGKDIDPVQKLRPDRYLLSARGKGFVKKRPRHSIPRAERIAAGISNCISPSGICTATCSVRPLTQTLPPSLSRISKSTTSFSLHSATVALQMNSSP